MRRFASKTLERVFASRGKNKARHLRVLGIHGNLVLCSVADQTLVIGEGDIRRGCAVSLVVGDDLNTIVLPDTNTSKTKKIENQ